MLVLSRKLNESIIIGQDITVTVVGIFGDKVKIGVAAPRDTPVHRQEVAEKIEEERREQREQAAMEQAERNGR